MKKNGLVYLMAWLRLLPKIETDVLYHLSVELDVTYSHLAKIVKEFKARGWIRTEKIGRTLKVSLTPEGKKLADCCEKIIEAVNKRG